MFFSIFSSRFGRRLLSFSSLLALLFSASVHAGPSEGATSKVIPIQWKSHNIKPEKLSKVLDTSEMENLKKLLAGANRYALNTWYSEKGFLEDSGKYLDFGGTNEHKIRPAAHEAFSLAVALKWEIYDEEAIHVPKKEALARTVKIIESIAYRHKANFGEKGWGNAWQSALWASQSALAGWFLWEELSNEGKLLTAKMLEYEANRFLKYKVPYYQDKEGRILFPGDSKAEENSWNSTILAAACSMMPGSPNWEQWNRKAMELQVSAYSAPGDWNRNGSVNGFSYADLDGSNIEENGLVINHNIIHPDYMTAIMHSSTNVIIYHMGGINMPAASLFNGEKVYYAMTSLSVGKEKETMYVKTREGDPTMNLYYPQGNDWGGMRQANYWLMDVMADCFSWDKNMKIKGSQWARTRIPEMLRMQGRSETGQYYQSLAEDKFQSREGWVAFHLAFGYLLYWLQAETEMKFTSAPLIPGNFCDKK